MNQGTKGSTSFNRWTPVVASIAIQLCLGTAYIWGVFQSYLIITKATPNALFKWPATHGTLAYALLLFVLTFGSTVGGRIQDRLKNPRPVIVAAGIIMGIGFFLAQFTTEATPWLLWLTYGILGGFGMGMAYTTTIATCQKWFPDKRGLVTGIIVSALGMGGVVFSLFAEAVIKKVGVLQTFAVLGVVFIIVTIVGSFFVKNPPKGFKPEGWTPPAPKDGIIAQNFTPLEVLKTPQFYMVTLALMCATAAGSMMIPMAKVLGLQPDSGLTKQAALLGVTIISACNSFGRLFWGWTSDKLGRRNTLLVLLVLAGASIVGVSFAKAYLMLVLIAVIGFSYGGFLGVFPSLTADFFGTKNVATIYGMILLGFGVGAVASSYTVAYLSASKAFSTAFFIAGAASVIGLIIVSFLKAPKLKAESNAAVNGYTQNRDL
jgi:MFS transporter, OFA family, oxalate/formate antiporter